MPGAIPAAAAVPVAGYGWHGGPGIFGILFGIFFLFLIFGLLRAAFSRGRGYGPGWGHGYGYGPGWGRGAGSVDGGPSRWREERDRRIADLHRRLHEEESGGSGSARSPARAARPGGSTPADAAHRSRRRPSRAVAAVSPSFGPRVSPMQTVLVVDDEPKIVQLARDYLEHAGFAVLTAGDGASALHAVRTRQPDLVILDLGLPGSTAWR